MQPARHRHFEVGIQHGPIVLLACSECRRQMSFPHGDKATRSQTPGILERQVFRATYAGLPPRSLIQVNLTRAGDSLARHASAGCNRMDQSESNDLRTARARPRTWLLGLLFAVPGKRGVAVKDADGEGKLHGVRAFFLRMEPFMARVEPACAATSEPGEPELMCFSAAASFGAAAVLLPAGAASMYRAQKLDRRYLAFCTLPLLFGIQQFSEGAIWIAGDLGYSNWVDDLSMIYMFFAWLAWPVWIPVSIYFLEPSNRRPIYLMFSILGGMLGATQYFPYLAHDGWLTTTFLPRAISYGGKELLDFVIGREATYVTYLALVIAPLLISSEKTARVFGVLVAAVVAVTYVFFSYAYISVFCFGGAVMSLYLVAAIFGKGTARAAA
jgi:hypothetical protein